VGVIVAGDTITQVKIYWSSDPDYSAELKVKAVNVCGESEFSDPLIIYVNWSVGMAMNSKNIPFDIYPNPNTGEFHIDLKRELTIRSTRIFSNQGRIIKEITGIGEDQKLVVKNLSPGIYYLVIETLDGKYFEKVIVQ